jgi:hypothetical protein
VLEAGKLMKKLVAINLLCFVFVFLITPVHASVTVQGLIEQDIHVVYIIENINSTLYEKILEQKIFNISTIPQAIEKYFEEQNLENVKLDYDPTKEIFNNSTKSIHVEFYLSGSDILDSTPNRAALTKTYNVKTGWRKVHVNLTDDFSLDFATYFQKPVSEWQIINYTINGEVHPTYLYNYTDTTTFDPLCRFVLPSKATNIHATRDTIIFELPIPLEDNLINSPFLVLGVLIIVNIALIAYRKIRR